MENGFVGDLRLSGPRPLVSLDINYSVVYYTVTLIRHFAVLLCRATGIRVCELEGPVSMKHIPNFIISVDASAVM
jgi:hypothetical protein